MYSYYGFDGKWHIAFHNPGGDEAWNRRIDIINHPGAESLYCADYETRGQADNAIMAIVFAIKENS